MYSQMRAAGRRSGLASVITAVGVFFMSSRMRIFGSCRMRSLPEDIVARAQQALCRGVVLPLSVVWSQVRGTYDDFDDQVEIITQLGYVVLFSAHMPLLPVLALLSNIVESRSDLFKLCFALRYTSAQMPALSRIFCPGDHCQSKSRRRSHELGFP